MLAWCQCITANTLNSYCTSKFMQRICILKLQLTSKENHLPIKNPYERLLVWGKSCRPKDPIPKGRW